MEKKNAARVRVVGVTLAGLMLLPALGAVANASPSDGGFQVEAHNVEEPTIQGIAGMAPSFSAPVETTPPEPVDAVTHPYTCGPMTFNITESMIARSASNWDAWQRKDYASMNVDTSGWSVLQQHSPTIGTVKGTVLAGERPAIFTAENGPTGNGGNPTRSVRVEDSAARCEISDYRTLATAKVGDLIGYTVNRTTEATTETRVVEIAGVRMLETQTITKAGALSKIVRNNASLPLMPISGDIPAEITYNSTGAASGVKYRFNTSASGSEYWTLEMLQSGTTIRETIPARMLSNPLPDGSPANVQWNSSGQVVSQGWPTMTPTTLSQWNSSKGTNWDGKIPAVHAKAGLTPSFPAIGAA